MNRVIKFRAWDKEEKVMIAADAWYFSEEFEPFIDSVEKCLRRFELMQFTGLQDKNGTERYEGDVISYSISQTQHYRGVIKWDNKCAGFYIDCFWAKEEGFGKPRKVYYEGASSQHHGYGGAYDVIVLGNIHQHPDLLKKE